MKRRYYTNSITVFLETRPDEILGKLARNTKFGLDLEQRDARLEEIKRTDTRIDELVYKLYGITDDERKIIEGSLK